MSITRMAIEKNRITLVALLIIVGAGISSYRTMPQSEDPGFIVRTALVQTLLPGASPERIENLVTDPIETAIQQMPELDFITSESSTGLSIIYVNIKESYKEMRPIWDSLRRKVDNARAGLPEGVIGPVVNDEFGDVFGVLFTITGEGYTYAELRDVADEVRDELLTIRDVAKVDIYGAQEERVFIEYDNARLAQLNLSPGQLGRLLESQNILFPGGRLSTGKERIVLEPSGNFQTLEEVRHSVITLPGRGEVLYLEDIARIERGYTDPPKSKLRSSGIPALGIGVSMRDGGNIIEMGRDIRTMISRLQLKYPIGIEFDFVAFQPDEVESNVNNFVRSLLQAVALVVLVMIVTLGVRTGIVVATLIPMAILLSLWIMSMFHITLNTVSLAALIIALGMLVDNAIVMSESIMVMIQSGVRPMDAAINSVKELRTPLLTSSLTTAAAFLSIFLAESSTGEYTADLFKVVTIALLASWVLSLTMVPMFCYRFIKVKAAKEQSFEGKFYGRYRRFLIRVLKHPWISLAVVAAIFLASMQLQRFIPALFFPPSERAFLRAELTFPAGTPIERTEDMVDDLEGFFEETLKVGDGREQGITNWASFIGIGAPRFYLSADPKPQREELAYLLINTTDRATADEMRPRIEDYLWNRYPDLNSVIQPLDYGPPVVAPIEVRLSGKDMDRLFSIVDEVKARLDGIAGTRNIGDDWGPRVKKLMVEVNQPRARRAGVSSSDIAVSLQSILSGITVTEFREQEDVIPVVMRGAAADRQDIGKLETLDIYSQASGRTVPLKQVADIVPEWEPSKIHRRDRIKTVTVSAFLDPDFTATEVVGELTPWLERQEAEWPIGYSYEFGGEIESSIESQQAIVAKLPITFGVIILLLVGQFNSFRRPLIILFTIPLAMIGVNVGLVVLRGNMGFMTFLGIISLAGIVINNAIVLLDRIRIEIEELGTEPPRAVIEAAQKRLRPILLTTVTTVGGLLPLYLSGGPMWQSMAIAIMFGLIFSTTLTLGVVPLLYSLFFRVSFKRYEH